jgi:hypothetical protein
MENLWLDDESHFFKGIQYANLREIIPLDGIWEET